MKRIIPFAIILLLMVSFIGYSQYKNKKIYGKYKFDKLIYVWVASSKTRDCLREEYAGTKYIIKKDKFEIINSKNEIETEIKNPTYKKEEMKDDLIKNHNFLL